MGNKYMGKDMTPEGAGGIRGSCRVAARVLAGRHLHGAGARVPGADVPGRRPVPRLLRRMGARCGGILSICRLDFWDPGRSGPPSAWIGPGC